MYLVRIPSVLVQCLCMLNCGTRQTSEWSPTHHANENEQGQPRRSAGVVSCLGALDCCCAMQLDEACYVYIRTTRRIPPCPARSDNATPDVPRQKRTECLFAAAVAPEPPQLQAAHGPASAKRGECIAQSGWVGSLVSSCHRLEWHL